VLLIRRVERYVNRAQTSNEFEFLWHEMFQQGVNDRSPKESQTEESHLEESQRGRLRLPGHELQKAQLVTRVASCKQYPQLHEALADYMQADGGEERVHPRARHVVDVMDAAKGAAEQEVVDCLQYLLQERGLKPGTRSGPRHFSWFPTVVGDYFRQKRERQQAANPVGGSGSPRSAHGDGISQAVFDSMIDPVEIEGSRWTV